MKGLLSLIQEFVNVFVTRLDRCKFCAVPVARRRQRTLVNRYFGRYLVNNWELRKGNFLEILFCHF